MQFNTLFYHRPAFVPPRPRCSKDSSAYPLVRTSTSSSGKPPSTGGGIPSALSFDKILQGKTCPPCTLRDMMNYCLYVEHSAENLQFFLWLNDYTERFQRARQSEQSLSPEWTAKDQELAVRRVRAEAQEAIKSPQVSWQAREILRGTTFSSPEIMSPTSVSMSMSAAPTPTVEGEDPFGTPPSTPSFAPVRLPKRVGSIRTATSRDESLASGFSAATIASESFANAGLSEPFTIQPFREEIDRIIATYISDDSPRELNIDGTGKNALLLALQRTTHPSAFNYIRTVIEDTLRTQVHPNFIRYTLCNACHPRLIFCKGLGVTLMLAGILTSLMLTLSRSHTARAWRLLGAILITLGVATIHSATKGVCAVIYALHRRHLRPWEIYVDDDDDNYNNETHHHFEIADGGGGGGGDTSNPVDRAFSWMTKYHKRKLIRKIFDREVWVQERAVRRIHDRIFGQAALIGTAVAAVLMVVFLLVPGVKAVG